jgi:peptide/nickel transport system substrate-binding protein
MVQLLCFNDDRPPFAQRPWRAAVRDTIDRAALIRAAEHGFARPCTTVFAPEIADWPDAAAPSTAAAEASATRADGTTAELLVVSTDPAQLWLAVELQRQLRPAGIDLRLATVTPTEHGRRVKAGEFDLYVTRTWGTPYDPQATLYARFRAETKQKRSVFFADPELLPLIDQAQRLDPGPQRAAVYARVQRLLDERIAVVPLYVPDRIALLGPHADGIALGPVVYGIDLTHLRRID